MNRAGIQAKAIHGDKSQNQRQRALEEFKACKIAVLVATDIAARGIDINELPLVINFDLPNIPETYVHRIGRTGRAGQEGTAISFCDRSERPYLADIEKLIGKRIPLAGEIPHVEKENERAGRGKRSAQDNQCAHAPQAGFGECFCGRGCRRCRKGKSGKAKGTQKCCRKASLSQGESSRSTK